jgi:alpha-glucuronidase
VLHIYATLYFIFSNKNTPLLFSYEMRLTTWYGSDVARSLCLCDNSLACQANYTEWDTPYNSHVYQYVHECPELDAIHFHVFPMDFRPTSSSGVLLSVYQFILQIIFSLSTLSKNKEKHIIQEIYIIIWRYLNEL